MELPCTVHLCVWLLGWFLWWEVCCVNIALTIHQKHTYTFFLFTERSRLLLQSTEQSLCCGKLSIFIPLPGLGQFSRNSVLPQDIFMYFGIPLVHILGEPEFQFSSPGAGWVLGSKRALKMSWKPRENIDIGQRPAQRPRNNNNVLIVLDFTLNSEVK